MGRFCLLGLLALLGAAGCARWSAPAACDNPAFVSVAHPETTWLHIVDVVDDYFDIRSEERVRTVGDIQVEGRIDTFPQISATLLEPWRFDSVGSYQRVESTLQTIRRYAIVRVIPQPEGYLLDVSVFKELEDLQQPEQATASAAAFRVDSSPHGFSQPVGDQPVTLGWIPLGRDPLLEETIVRRIQERLGGQQGPQGLQFGWGAAAAH